jgi:hypothetical protein
MDGIKIDVIGNVAKVIKKPSRITSGTVGLPIEYTFDEQWDGLTKAAVFRGGAIEKSVDLVADLVVPWEVLLVPGVWLSVGVYGENEDGSVAIPTIWANVLPISVGVDPEGDPSTKPTPSIWQEINNKIDSMDDRIDNIVLEAAPIPDWEQTDPNGPGYIKNKPDLSNIEQVVKNKEAIETIEENISNIQDDLGDIESSLNSIIAIQESIIGGESV